MTWLWQPLLPGGAQLLASLPAREATAAQAFSIGQTATATVLIEAEASQGFTLGQTFTGTVEQPASAATALGPGWGERTYRLEWRDRKWVKRKEREDELASLVRQVYAELSGEAPAVVIADDEAAPAEVAAAKAVQALSPFKDGSGIDWQALESNARAVAALEDALEAYIKARDEEDDWLLMVAA